MLGLLLQREEGHRNKGELVHLGQRMEFSGIGRDLTFQVTQNIKESIQFDKSMTWSGDPPPRKAGSL